MASGSNVYRGGGSWRVPDAIRYVQYFVVGGGGGGGGPMDSGVPRFGCCGSPGGGSGISTTGLYAGGGGGGGLYSGGSGGYGNWAYGQSGYYASSLGSRASSGYGGYGSGGAGASWSSSNSTPSSYGGGGGGASYQFVSRGSNGAIAGQYVSFYVGGGGSQGGVGGRRYGDSGAIYVYFTTYDPPVPSISASPNPIINGQSTTISWSVGTADDCTFILSSNTGTFSVSNNSNRVFSPTSSTTYTITASNPAYTRSASVYVTVYQPPQTFISASPNPIVRGESTTLSWTTTGDASTANVQPGVGNTNVNGSTVVAPTTDIRYTINVSGNGGSDSDFVDIIVYQPPTVDINGPLSLDYDTQGVIQWEATNAPDSITVTPTYYYTSYNVTGDPINLPTGDNVNGQFDTIIPYNDEGPREVRYDIHVEGYGPLTADDFMTISINIDEKPENMIVPTSDEKFKDEEPVITPDGEVTTYKMEVLDIDIPVEIKSNRPIQVQVDDGEDWLNIRQK